MKTLVYNIECSEADREVLKLLQHQGNIDFRKCFNNMDLWQDIGFINSLNIKSKRYQEYLYKEVMSFYKKVEASKNKVLDKINELHEKREKKPLTQKEFKKLSELKTSYNSKIVFGGKANLRKRTKGLISHEEFQENRLYPLTFYGEANKKGSRFFDFSNLSNGQILFKMEATKIKIPLTFSNKKHYDELVLLQSMALNNEIPITIKLSHDIICISFDESKLNGSNMNYRKLSKSAPSKITNLPAYNAYWTSEHRKHENYLKQGKFERYLSLDLNPNQIGFVITDENMNILDMGSYELEGKMSSDKRKYEYSIIIKQLFKKIEHYKCSYIVVEDLEGIVKEDYGNKTSNRKIKSEWKLNYLKELIVRNSNESKTIIREVNPYLSSVLGNLTTKYYDCIGSALEIARRGINRFTKGFVLIPDIDPNKIMTDIANKLRIDYKIDLASFQSYQELYKSIWNKSYRRKEKSFLSYLLTKKSNVFVYR